MRVHLIVLVLLCCLDGWGANRTISQFVHKAWTAKDGAPVNIRVIAQTTDGVLWLAGNQGLYRFDGVQFERYDPLGQPAAAPVFALLSCPNGDLWIGSGISGITLLRQGSNRNYTAADGFPGGVVASIVQDRQGNVWASAQGVLARFDGKNWRKVSAELGFEGNPRSLYVARDGTLWASSKGAIFALPQGASVFRRTMPHAVFVSHMLESPDGTMWMAETGRSVRPMPPSTRDAEVVVGSTRLLFDREGSLWVTSLGDGLHRIPYPDRLTHEKFVKTSDGMEHFTSKDGLSGDYAMFVYRDREGNIWVGTNSGLDRFTKGAVVPVPVLGRLARIAMVPSTDGDVRVGGMSGENGVIHENKYFHEERLSAFSIAPDPNSGSWWPGFVGGFREVRGRFTPFSFPSAYAPNLSPVFMTVDRSGAVWISGSYGYFVRREGVWTAFDPPVEVAGKTPSLDYTDAAGRLWFGFSDGSIFLIDGATQRVFTAKDGLRVGAVQGVFRGSHTWIAGATGLQVFDGQQFRDVRPEDDETFGNVSGVLETSDGTLWLNTSRGIVRIAPAETVKLKGVGGTVRYSIFDSYDGLPGATQQSVPRPTLIQATDGKLWFSSSNGPVWIDPKDIPRNELPPAVEVRSVIANGKRYDSFANLRLPALTRDLEIAYTALSFTIPERVRFRYRLDGSDKIWREAGTRRRAFYTNLGPGEYQFRVMACNNDGVWSEAGAVASFRIDAAFYQTTWFMALCSLAGLVLLWSLYRYRLQQAKAEVQSRMEGRIAERERIARELHDTLLQSVQGLMLHLQVVDELLPLGKAKEKLEQSLERVDEAILEGRSAVQGLRSSTMEGKNLAEALRDTAKDYVDSSTTFRLVVEGAVMELQPILRDDVYRIAREALRNAFDHAQARHVEGEISCGRRVFRLRIRDDGAGIPAEVLAEGRYGHYGLRGMRERARQTGASLDIWSSAGTGTEIDLRIPASVAYSQPHRRSFWQLFRKRVG